MDPMTNVVPLAALTLALLAAARFLWRAAPGAHAPGGVGPMYVQVRHAAKPGPPRPKGRRWTPRP